MTNPFENIEKAFEPFEEQLEWTQDKKPHSRGIFKGVVLQGSLESSSAGVSLSPLVADIWTIHTSEKILFLSEIKIGDTIGRLNCKDKLTVQQVYHDATGDFWISCTSNQRSPM